MVMKLLANQLVTGIILFLFVGVSCVPVRQYQDMKARNSKCEEERDYLKNQNKELS